MENLEGYPEIVYKYRSWGNEFHRNILINNELFLASPKDFNDPFDCRIPNNYYLLDNPEKIRLYVDKVTMRHFKTLISEGRDIEYEMKRIENKLINEIKDFQESNENQLFKEQDIRYGVLSLSCRWNSILMWSHYSDFHKGFCVGFFEKKLRESRLFGKGGPVAYDINFPQLSPLDDNIIQKSFKETHFKANEWSYEEEYRLTKLFYPKIPTNTERIVRIPDDYISEVIIGVSTPENIRDEIIKIARLKDIKIFQAIKLPFKFEIGRSEI